MKSKEIRFETLDGIRGYFVLLIFFVHFVPNSAGYIGHTFSSKPFYQAGGIEVFCKWLQNSNYGVQGFFILSAFLIGRMILSSKYKGYLKFLSNRVLRIYPAFLISIIISGLMGIYYTHYLQISGFQIVENLFFLNGFFLLNDIPSLNFVTWSLFFEFVFYFTVPLVLLINQKFNQSRSLRLFVYFILISATGFFLKLGSPYLLFFGGIAISIFTDAELETFAKAVPERLLVLFYLSTTTIYSLSILNTETFSPVFLIACSALIVKANFDPQSHLSRVFNMRWLRKLGRISYSFYLLHPIVIIGFFYLLPHSFPNANKFIWLALSLPVTFLATTLASAILFKLVESPYFMRKSHNVRQAPINAA